MLVNFLEIIVAYLPEDSLHKSAHIETIPAETTPEAGSVEDNADKQEPDIPEKRFDILLGQALTDPGPRNQLNTIAPISLAYVGDAVFELYVRSRLLIPAKRIRDYHHLVVNHVKAEQQSHHLDVLMPHLSSDELDILRRGRNATTGRNRRANGPDYQKATGFEALIGFLYLSDQARLLELLNHLEI